MKLSNTAMHVLCIQLGLNCGKNGSGFEGITILSIKPYRSGGAYRYWVEGFYSVQDTEKPSKLDNTPFKVLL